MIAKGVIILWFALSAVYNITKIGKHREPTTPGEAALTVLICGALIALVATCWETE